MGSRSRRQNSGSAGAQWDQSQVWSDGAVFSPGNSFNDTIEKSAFKGIAFTWIESGTSVGSCTISFTGFGSVSSVDLYCTHASGVLNNANLSINETPVAGLANNDWPHMM